MRFTMHSILRLFVLLLGLALLSVGCVGAPEPEAPDEEGADVAEPEEEPEQDPPPPEEPEEESPSPEEPEEEHEEQREEEKEPAGDEPIEVSEALYEQTFDEVEAVIEELNEIIRARDFDTWQEYLTEAYLEEYSDPERLAEISDRPILKRNDITLESLEDYFEWVVVPSRQDARLDDLRFLSEDVVEAVMEVGGSRVILYRLRKVDGRWKVDAA